MEHDHAAAVGHDLAVGLEPAGFADLRALLGAAPGRASDLQFHGGLATMTVNGGAGGFLLLDLSDPAHARVVGRYRSGSEDNWYTKWSNDGRLVYLTANGNFNAQRAAGTLVADAQELAPDAAARGVQAVDVSDSANPRLVGVFPAPVRAINLAVRKVADTEYVFASIVDDRSVQGLPKPGLSPNHVSVLRRDDSPGGAVRLTEVARWSPPTELGAEVLVHDLSVDAHPVTGRLVLSAACWDAGAFFLDVTDPAAPREIGRFRPAGFPTAGLQVHTVKPHPGLVNGRQLTLVGVETFGGQPSGTYDLLDTTDPAHPALLDAWALPDNLTNPEPLLWSPHEFSLADGRAYTSNNHAGTYVFDLRNGTLAPVAAWAKPADGRPGWTPRPESAKWSVEHETAVWHDGLVWVVDMGAGIVALRESA